MGQRTRYLWQARLPRVPPPYTSRSSCMDESRWFQWTLRDPTQLYKPRLLSNTLHDNDRDHVAWNGVVHTWRTVCVYFWLVEVINHTPSVMLICILARKLCSSWLQVLITKQNCRCNCAYDKRNFQPEPFPQIYGHTYNSHYHHYTNSRRLWNFAFTHASTSSKSILFALQCLHRFSPFLDFQKTDRSNICLEWIVSEMVNWLKVCDPILMRERFWQLVRTKKQTLNRNRSWLLGWKVHTMRSKGWWQGGGMQNGGDLQSGQA